MVWVFRNRRLFGLSCACMWLHSQWVNALERQDSRPARAALSNEQRPGQDLLNDAPGQCATSHAETPEGTVKDEGSRATVPAPPALLRRDDPLGVSYGSDISKTDVRGPS
eukprot:1175567-Prorocentrum_minimum.AAC.3